MTDLGFGLADKRSVITILIIISLSSILFNYGIPLNLDSPFNIFSSLIILIGYIFFSRTVLRFILITIYTIIRIVIGLCSKKFGFYKENLDDSTSKIVFSIQDIKRSLDKDFYIGFIKPILYKEWNWHQSFSFYYDHKKKHYDLAILGLFDRIGLVGLSFIATIPIMKDVYQIIGLFGIGVLVITYVVTGRFTLLLTDAFHKVEMDQERLINAAETQPNIDFPSSIATYPSSTPYDNIGG